MCPQLVSKLTWIRDGTITNRSLETRSKLQVVLVLPEEVPVLCISNVTTFDAHYIEQETCSNVYIETVSREGEKTERLEDR
jgi:hypothetical protein